jgi:hypothetical protein
LVRAPCAFLFFAFPISLVLRFGDPPLARRDLDVFQLTRSHQQFDVTYLDGQPLSNLLLRIFRFRRGIVRGI